ncbi:MAG: RNA-binding transcriptional accessory protein [Negativicutes bacterium]|nr:RNA-binding transcriptional accessory protein [Negativicutes bacterium]MBP9537345.1 RNA-binding transcriptional accessory protein [Negativicutes bacterium]MBP9949717.1 RNA-binding transcriptional accessory protein [Negativicutes bacterium]
MVLNDISRLIAQELKIKEQQVNATIDLLDSGNTIPFISRYRKEVTGELTEEHIRHIEERTQYLRNLVKRQEEILASIEEQGKLTPELTSAIEKSIKLQELEDIYLPFRPKKRTRASIAKEKGLEPLAELILAQDNANNLEAIATDFINADLEVNSLEDAINGAMDIIAETVCEQAQIRALIRRQLWQKGQIATELNSEDPELIKPFLMYAEYSEAVNTLPSHRILAINRGEKKDILKVKLLTDHDNNIALIGQQIIKTTSNFSQTIITALTDGYKRLLLPSLEREIRTQLTENAEQQAIKVFGLNLKQLLLQAPLAGYNVMGLDPGYRTGCKVAIISPTGAVLDHGVLYLTASEGEKIKSAEKMLSLIKKHNVGLISIGNGTASYETEEFTAKLISDNNLDVHYLITNEAGASVYSASKLAVAELPDYDVTIRGAISIARRVQDPLAELVKIDPKSIGVGQYQHDVNQKELSATLDTVIESAVNHVGVELNTASSELLRHVAGVNATVAKNIISFRDENGTFKNRKQLLKVPRLGQAAFTQCAGFLRLAQSDYPLDNTPVHPESYPLTEQILAKFGFDIKDLKTKEKLVALKEVIQTANIEALAEELTAGIPTIRDILEALTKPGRDPREDLPAPLTRKNIVKLSDIVVGTVLKGTVHNVTDFGVFVDIGIKTNGLIHRSELSHKYFKHPLDIVSVGDVIDVMIINVEPERNRIGLSLKQVPAE